MVAYQWNCSSVHNKDLELSLHISGQENPPAVVALQEPNGKPSAPGYITYTDPSEKGTVVLVCKNVAATQHLTPQNGCEHTLVKVHAREIGSL